jgi:hypothetical protein
MKDLIMNKKLEVTLDYLVATAAAIGGAYVFFYVLFANS